MSESPVWYSPAAPPAPADDPGSAALRCLRHRLWIERGIFGIVVLILGWPYLAGVAGPREWTVAVYGKPAVTLRTRTEAMRALGLLRERTSLSAEAFRGVVRLQPGGGGPVLPHADAAVQAALPVLASSIRRGVIYVDGKPAVALPGRLDAEATLSEVKARGAANIPNLEAEPEFKQPVIVREEPAPEKLWCATVEEAAERLTTGHATGGEVYRVQPGDIGGTIASKHGLTLAQMGALNPDVNWNRLQIGQELRVSGALTPTLTVLAQGKEEQEVPVPYPVIRQPHPQLKRGRHKTIQQGKPGRDLCVFVVDYVGDRPAGPKRLERRERIEEPTPKIVLIGTRRR